MADRGFYPPSTRNGQNGDGSNGNGSSGGRLVPSRSRFDHVRELVVNFITSRLELIKRWLDPRRNLYYECGYPEGYISPSFYQKIYEMDPLGGRVVEVFPKECFQAGLEIYEDEDPDTVTGWEDALYNVCDSLGGENSYSQTSRLTRLIELFRRADIVSGICSYGCVIIGLDDNVDLSLPAQMRPPKPKKRKKAAAKVQEENPPEPTPGKEVEGGGRVVAPGGVTLSTNAAYYPPIPTSTAVPDERPYVRDAEGNLVLPGKNDPLAKPPPRKYPKGVTRGLQYVEVFPESYCRVSEWDLDPNSRRFGRPVMYTVQFGAVGQGEGSTMPTETKEVHWSRVVHLTDTSHHAPDNRNFAAPRMRPVLPRILDSQKVYGPDAESFYRNGIPTWVFETHPELAVELDKQSLKDEWEEGNNSLSRLFATEGGTMKPLATSIPDPTPHVMIQIQAICYKLGIPQRIFMGSERGELASSQDDAAWNDRLRERQNNYLTPMVVEPIIDRLISLGVLPEPEAEDGYKVWWPDLESQSDQEKSTVAGAYTTAIATFFDPTKELFTRMSEMDFWTKVMGYDDREAKQIIQNAEKEREKRKKEKEEEQKKQMTLQDQQARQGMERDLEFQQKQAEQQAAQAAAQGAPGAPTSQAQAEAGAVAAPSPADVLAEAGIAANSATNDLTDPTDNVFCKTGKGGGIDPTCKKGDAGSGVALGERLHKQKEALHEAKVKLADSSVLMTHRKDTILRFEKDISESEAKLKHYREELKKDPTSSFYGRRVTSTEGLLATYKDFHTRAKSEYKEMQSTHKKLTREVNKLEKEIGTKVKHLDNPKLKKSNEYTTKDLEKMLNEYDNKRIPGYISSGPTDRVAYVMVQNAKDVKGGVKRHGMSQDEDMKEVSINGMKVRFPKDPPSVGINALNHLIDSVVGGHEPKIPQKLLNANSEIVYTKQRNSDDPHWERTYNIPGFKSAATGGDGKVVVYNGKPMGGGTFAHESGHNLAKQTYGETHPHPESNYGKAQQKEKPVSPYGAKSPAEDFAEASKMYVHDRGMLKLRFPEKYKAIHEIIGD